MNKYNKGKQVVERIKESMEILQNHPEVAGLVGKFTKFSEFTKQFNNVAIVKKGNDFEEGSILKFKRVFSICTGKLIPKSSISKTLFDTKIQIGEDSLFMSTISGEIRAVVLIKEAIYYRRIRLGSAMGSKKSFRYQLNNSTYLIKKHLNLYFSKPKNYNFNFFTLRILAILKGFIWRSILN